MKRPDNYILSQAAYYLPPVSWFQEYLRSGGAAEPLGENILFRKQTLHNRCYIESPNGPLALSIPIVRGNFSEGGKCLLKDVMISDHLNWRHNHWYALESSYSHSPFFEYLKDDFYNIYNKEWKYLCDLNQALSEACLGLIHEFGYKSMPLQETGACRPSLDAYHQVFSHKNGFIADLSIIDLLFNMGNESGKFL